MNARWIGMVACVAVGLCGPARAQELQRFEITPFYGFTFSGGLENEETGDEFDIDDSSSYGGLVDVRVGDMTQLEFFFNRQETELDSEEGLFDGEDLLDLDVSYYHIGGTYIILDGPWQPFVVATLGATNLNPDYPGSESLTRFSVGIGGGVRYFPTDHLGLYLGGRGLFTFIGDDAIVESRSGALTIEVDGDGLWQLLLQAGVIIAF